MQNEAGKLVEEGLHHDTFDAVHCEICFERSVDYWTRDLINAYNNVIRNIYISEGDIDGHLVDFLEEFLEGIESHWNHTSRNPECYG